MTLWEILLISSFFFGRSAADGIVRRECIDDAKGLNYRGTTSHSLDDIECQRWDSETPWMHIYNTSDIMLGLEENYCRNPDSDEGGPWCVLNTLNRFWDYCDVPLCVDECSLNLDNCHANATCTDLDRGFDCTCEISTVGNGVNCTAAGLCEGNVCVNGICVVVDGDFKCLCITGYEGRLCDDDIDECKRDPGICNFGHCQNLIGSFVCTCIDGWTGILCDANINECEIPTHSMCSTNAQCIDNVGSFECTCNPGYCGDGITCDADNLIPINLDSSSFLSYRFGYPIVLRTPIRFGSQTYVIVHIHKNGLIYLANTFLFLSLNHVFPDPDLRLISPLWDRFFLSQTHGSIVVWEIYQNSNGLESSGDPTLDGALVLVGQSSNMFNPFIVLVVEWREVIPHPPGQYFDNRSTFQCILASDGATTIVFFIYRSCDYLWIPGSGLFGASGLVPSFIGYINSNGVTRVPIDENAPYQDSNIGLPGVYEYVVSDMADTAADLCLAWFAQEPPIATWLSFSACPWTRFFALRDRRWIMAPANKLRLLFIGLDSSIFAKNDRVCFQSRLASLDFPYSGPLCCYTSLFGQLLTSESWYQRTQLPAFFASSSHITDAYNQYRETEYEAERNCFLAGAYFISLFRSRRPGLTSFGYVFPLRIRGWGDPHIQTLYGKQYTFNGLGEYFLIEIPDKFILQARMLRALDMNGNATEATVITSLVAQDVQTNNKVMFEPSASGDDQLVVTINGIITQFPDELNVEATLPNLSFQKSSDQNHDVIFSPDVSITVFSSGGVLGYAISVSDDFRDQVKGLLGRFERRDTTVIAESDLLITDRNDILNGTFDQEKMWNYGQTWSVGEDESIFTYPPGTNWTTFNPEGHLPPFLTDLVDDLTPDEFASISSTCSDQLPCIYDLAVTNDMEFAMMTMSISLQSIQEEALATNRPPSISWPSSNGGELRFIVGEEATHQFTATDPDTANDITFSVNDLHGVTINANSGLLTVDIDSSLIENALNDSSIQLLVFVSDGLVTVVVVVPVLLCDCSGSGTCLWDSPVQGGPPGFGVVICECNDGYGGGFCMDDLDACMGNPCFTSCEDLPAPDGGFICSPCPSGLTGNGTECSDIDECETGEHSCSPTTECVNTIMSYECACLPGTQKPPEAGPMDSCIGQCINMPCRIDQGCVDILPDSFSCQCPLQLAEVEGMCPMHFTVIVEDFDNSRRKRSVNGLNTFNETAFANALSCILEEVIDGDPIVVVVVEVLSHPPNGVRVEFVIADLSALVIFIALREQILAGNDKGITFIALPVPVHRSIEEVCTNSVIPAGDLLDDINSEDFLIDTTCENGLTTITISTCNITKVGAIPENLVLGSIDGPVDPACTPVILDTPEGGLSTVFLHTSNRTSCGTQIEVADSTITYTYTIRSNEMIPGQKIQRYHTCLTITASCVYDRTEIVSMKDSVKPMKKLVQLLEEGDQSEFRFDTGFFTDEMCMLPLLGVGSNPPEIFVPDIVYYKISSLDLEEQNVITQARDCWATPTPNPMDPMRHDFIRDGCKAENTERIEIVTNYKETFIKFGFNSFRWAELPDNLQIIHVHCDVLICHLESGNDCSPPQCSTRRKRSKHGRHKKGKSFKTVTSGPMNVVSPCSKPGTCDQNCDFKTGRVMCSCTENFVLADDDKTCIQINSQNQPKINGDDSVFDGFKSVTSSQANRTLLILIVVFMVVIITTYVISKCWRDGDYSRIDDDVDG